MKQVTVVIPNWNGSKYLEKCLDALLTQQGVFDVIVVDNGSTDGSVEILANKYPTVKTILLKENTGFCHACNVGIEASDTPYVILLNNDTEVQPGFVENLVKAIEADERIFSVSAQMLQIQNPELIDSAGDMYTLMGWGYSRGKGKPAKNYDKPVKIFSACGGAAIYRKSILDKIGLLDENHFAYLEDMDLGYRARIYGYTNMYESTAKVIHAGSASSGSRYNEFKTKLAAANNAYMIGKNMPFLQLIFNLPFIFAGVVVKAVFFARKGMGRLYLRSYFEGIRRCFSEEGKKHRIKFRWGNLGNYLRIEVELIFNVFGMLR
ncbi:MAG: glycosyltransferase family 2 protein [Lachnospiraceae bacterium]|nr:glycosyltransferase family 2 protein [Lachnospiraceae bacterium]